MKFALLTNQVRAERRAPLRVPLASGAVLARLFPEIKRASPARQTIKPEPGQRSPGAQPNRKKSQPGQTPLEAFSAPTIFSPVEAGMKNGKPVPGPRNGFARSPEKPGASPLPRSGAAWLPRQPAAVPGPSPAFPASPISPPDRPVPQREAPGPQTQPPAPEASQPEEKTLPPAPREETTRPVFQDADRSALSLHRLIERHPDLPSQSILLGACEDGLPLVLDLRDPDPGSLLAIGDDREGQLELLRNVIDSAASRNSPRELQFLVISHQPQVWQAWVKERRFARHCLAIAGAEDERVSEWILRLADWTEQRRLGQLSGPPVLLVMDTLALLSRLAYDVRLNFDWMLKEGPSAQIWPLAAISTDLAASLGSRMLRGFQSRILGFAKDPRVYASLVNLSPEETGRFQDPRCFSVQVGGRWIHFQLPG